MPSRSIEKRSHSSWGAVSAMLREIMDVSIPCLCASRQSAASQG